MHQFRIGELLAEASDHSCVPVRRAQILSDLMDAIRHQHQEVLKDRRSLLREQWNNVPQSDPQHYADLFPLVVSLCANRAQDRSCALVQWKVFVGAKRSGRASNGAVVSLRAVPARVMAGARV